MNNVNVKHDCVRALENAKNKIDRLPKDEDLIQARTYLDEASICLDRYFQSGNGWSWQFDDWSLLVSEIRRFKEWAEETEHPEGSICSHFGELLSVGDKIRLGICPKSPTTSLFTIEVKDPRWEERPSLYGLAKLAPLDDYFWNRVHEIVDSEFSILDTWNGKCGMDSGSWIVDFNCHPSFIKAVEKYHESPMTPRPGFRLFKRMQRLDNE